MSWIVDSAIPRGTVCLFSGAGGGGKSYLSLQLQVAAASYRRWCGLYVAPCKSFGLYCEDPENVLHKRVQSICFHEGLAKGDLEDMTLKSMEGEDATLWEADRYGSTWRTTPLWAQVVEHVCDTGAQLVILDTVARVFGGNENVRNHVTAFVAESEKLARKIDGAVMLNIHPSKAGDSYSGSTAWQSTVRAHLDLKRPKGYDPEKTDADHDGRFLRIMKANWSGVGGLIPLRWRNGWFALDRPEPAPYKPD